MKRNIGLLLAKRATLNPDLEALVDAESGLRLTFRQLDDWTNRTAHVLRAAGLRKGDRCALLMKNSPAFIAIYMAIAKIGVVAVPLNWRLTPSEIGYILSDCRARTLVFDVGFAPVVETLKTTEPARLALSELISVGGQAVLASPTLNYDEAVMEAASSPPVTGAEERDLLFIMYTSGTTGQPKGVMHTHESILWSTITVSATLDTRWRDRSLLMMPLFHVGGLTSVTCNIYRGVTSVLLPGFDAQRVWRLIETERITMTSAVPAMLAEMLAAYDKSISHTSLRWIVVGAAPVPPALIERYAEIGIDLNQIYGLTESGGPACALLADRARDKVGSTGKAYFHTDIRVVTAKGQDVKPGEVGEILVSGPHLMAGYWERPEATRDALRDGWLHTGDLATIDNEGFVYIVDRLKDMIISGGENIYPAEIEATLLRHPGVLEAAVVGAPNERWGEVPVAFITPKPGVTLDTATLAAFCATRLAKFKIPKSFLLVEQLPRNASGKVLKSSLRQRLPA